MRVKVPNTLSGGSLLDAHKWVKSQMARTNPGGSADYTLRSIDGGNLTLSDIIRNNPNQNQVEVEIVMAGMNGVRSNPRGISIPTDFSSSPSFPRTGNFTSALLPKNLDPQLVERMVAQEGLFGAVQTLTILLSERSPAESMSPTTAGLLYAHSAIPRSNPSVKTPFLADSPKEMIDSDIRIIRYLNETQNVDLERAESQVDGAKLSAKYGMTKALLDTFVDDVLAPFMAVAPANRGALRHINKKLPTIASGKKPRKDMEGSYAKLMEMMPTKAEDFYHGRDYGLIAAPQSIYPLLCEKILPPMAVKLLLDLAKDYPDNLIRDDQGKPSLKLKGEQKKLVFNQSAHGFGISLRGMFTRIFKPGSPNINMAIKAKEVLMRGEKRDDDQYIALIIDAINAPGIIDSISPSTSKLAFTKNIGGFFPSPPKNWPHQVVYAVMDTFIVNLPEIVNLESPQDNYESLVYKMLHSPKDSLDNIVIDGNDILKADIEDAMGDKPKRKALVAELEKEFKFDASVKTELEDSGSEFLAFVMANSSTTNTIIGKIDPKFGKSTFELLFEVIETSKGKYNYDLVDDDITFALMLIDYSIKRLFEDGKGKTAPVEPLVSLGGLVGKDRLKGYLKQAEAILARQTDETEMGQTRLVVEAGLVAGYIDALIAETNDDLTLKQEKLRDLEEFTAEYKAIKMDASIKRIGVETLESGRQQLQGILV
jgi:hypothetical protein